MSAARELLTDAYETSLQALQSPEQWWQVLILALAGLAAWLIARLLRKKITEHVADESSSAALARAELANRITLPTVLGLLCLLAAGVFRGSDFPHGMLFVAGELALALVAIQLLAAAMKRIIKPGPLLVTFDHIIPWIVWFAVAIHLLGWTEPLAGALDSIGIPLDPPHKIIRKKILVKISLQGIGQGFQWTVPVTKLHQANAVGQQKIIDPEPVPLGHMNDFVKTEALRLTPVIYKEGIVVGDTRDRHGFK